MTTSAVSSVLPQVGEQCRAGGGVLGGALADAEHVLPSVGVDADRRAT